MFVPVNPRGARRGAQGASFLLSVIAALLAVGIAGARHNRHLSVPWVAGALGGVIVGFALFLFVRRMNAPEPSDEPPMAPPTEEAAMQERLQWLVVIGAIVAGLVALGLFLSLSARPANSQEPARQSAFVLTRGADTLVVERVTRDDSTVQGDLAIKGVARMTFHAAVTAGPSVRLLSFKAWGAGASIDSPPVQSGTQRFTADSAFIVVTAGGAEQRMRKAISRNPLPLINNDFAMFELAIQRARAQGGDKASVPMFALSGGVQLDVSFEFFGADSVVVRIMGQETRFVLDRAGRITRGSVPSQNVTITRVEGAAAATISIGRPDYSAPAGAPYRAEEVTVQTPAGHVLSGTLTMPLVAKGKVPAVVTITGSGLQDRDQYVSLVPGYRPFRQVADTLGRRGIAVLRLDDRGINGSGGDLMKATSADFADDIRAGIAFLRARPNIDAARVALLGHSEGGLIAPLIASTDAKVAGIVLMAGPGFTGRHTIETQNDTSIAQTPGLSRAQRDSLRRLVKPALDSIERAGGWLAYFLRYDPLPAARRVRAPVLILQGSTDQQVTPEQAPVLQQAFTSAGNKDVTLKVFKDRNHLFLRDANGSFFGYSSLTNGRVDDEVMGTIADWLVAHLKP